MDKKTLSAGAVLTALIWIILSLWLWVAPARELSEAERRPLKQMPEISVDTLLKGRFMTEFEEYTLDQFPLRDAFRKVKSLFHFYILNQGDNNGIYLTQGHAVKQEYPLNADSLDHAADRLCYLYEKYLTDSDIYLAIVPDKGQYLAKQSGHLTAEYSEICEIMQERMPWAKNIDLYSTLDAEDYYRTDIHWRQEKLLPAAQAICQALGVTPPRQENYTPMPLERPFYGVYYGQAALPMEPETLYVMNSELLDRCRVYDFESGSYGDVYNMEKLTGRDLYDVFLSGSRSLLTVENPGAKTDRELIVFRDSFGSSIVPLILEDYAKVTLVDIRYIQIDVLSRYLEFSGQDVLMLYSTSVLNNSQTIK